MKNEQSMGRMKHTDPHFWRFVTGYLLLISGSLLFADGVFEWAMDQANTSILNTSFIAGCAAIFVGSIAFPRAKRRTKQTASESPESDFGQGPEL